MRSQVLTWSAEIFDLLHFVWGSGPDGGWDNWGFVLSVSSKTQRFFGFGVHPGGTSGKGNLRFCCQKPITRRTQQMAYHRSSATGSCDSKNPAVTGRPSRKYCTDAGLLNTSIIRLQATQSKTYLFYSIFFITPSPDYDRIVIISIVMVISKTSTRLLVTMVIDIQIVIFSIIKGA